jgi:hypothetical protein
MVPTLPIPRSKCYTRRERFFKRMWFFYFFRKQEVFQDKVLESQTFPLKNKLLDCARKENTSKGRHTVGFFLSSCLGPSLPPLLAAGIGKLYRRHKGRNSKREQRLQLAEKRGGGGSDLNKTTEHGGPFHLPFLHECTLLW